jgi:DNA-binding protein YbaB
MSDRSDLPDPAEAMRQFEQIKADAEATKRRYDELSAELGLATVEAFSDDGLVRVRLDANGRVDKVVIDELGMRHRQALGHIVKAVAEEAKAMYAIKAAEMAQALVGDKIDVQGIVGRYMPDDVRERARENLRRRE